MRETICTIPVNEVFERAGGCPVCRMRAEIEEKHIDYVTGAAMMEPDVRGMTNKTGFCRRHFDGIQNINGRRLSVSLMLETHLAEVEENVLARPGDASKAAMLEQSCFVCDCIDTHLSRAVDTIYRTYRSEEEFRRLFRAQEYLCLPHYRMLMQGNKGPSPKALLGKLWGEFCGESHRLALERVRLLRRRLAGFAEAFDYRQSAGGMPEESRRSIEDTIEFLTGETGDL
ncbi:MAG: DUF6062 family protein [Oscillospiraceae bacterium]|nr:DUF6062 family protein [Oscillospiraceae bacterium]